ncbi:hypothetical protein [Paracidovorax citrulli]|uniref:hypothetical protein n=1 Tax=Paracidovorax citrulli TaxID=80869 RepID=UPI000B22D427|nr:hypothetical protein [Paracidovorax citrulli]UEG47327.1 hypothetical protein LKW27_05500 [Paracidovorax citrulli]UMT95874.1 hypothetical protein FRC97_13145 [Paracidovorax citrulli]
MQLSKYIILALSLSCFSSYSYATTIETTLFSFSISPNLNVEDDKEKRITLYNKDGSLDPFVGIEYFKKEKTKTSKNTESDCTEEFKKLIEDGAKDSSTSKIEKSRESDRYLYTTKITTPQKTRISITYYCSAKLGVYITVLSQKTPDVADQIHSQIISTIKFKEN